MAATRACALPTRLAMRGSVVIAQHPVRPAARRQRRLVLGDQLRDRARRSRAPDSRWKLNGRCAPLQIARRNRPPAARPAGRPRRSARDRRNSSSTRASRRRRRAPPAGRSCRAAAARSCGGSPGAKSGLGGLSRNWSSLIRCQITSTRKPSTPRSQPEAQDVVHGAPHLGIAPVEVRLLLAGRRGSSTGRVASIELPCAAAELADSQLLGGPPSGAGVAPDVPVAFGIVARRSALDEPGMLVGGVVGHEIEDELQPAACAAASSASKSSIVPNIGSMPRVVGDVVAEIRHRRGIDRRQPDGIDAELTQIVSRAMMPARSPMPSPSCPERSADRSDRRRRAATRDQSLPY